MPNTNPSASMNMPIPAVGIDPGPDWADDLNSCLTIVDGHDHTPGYGVQITPDGLNINADLSFLGNNATVLRSARFQSQSAPLSAGADLDCVYVSGVDLYYNDGNGNQVRITQSGGVAGSPGSISNLASPASASYVSANQTFVWESDANVPANLDAGSVILRNITANSKGVTLNAHAALASDYDITFPAALPGSTKIVSLDSAGNIGATYGVDNSTIEISSNNLQVKDSGITTAKINNSAVTTAKIADSAVTLAKIAFGVNFQSTTIGSTTTWDAPAGVSVIVVRGCGGGGGGGGGKSAGAGGGGGGGGAQPSTTILNVTPGSTYTITIGAGGNSGGPGADANPGGTTTFGSLWRWYGARGGGGGGSSPGGGGSLSAGFGFVASGGDGGNAGAGSAATAGVIAAGGNGGTGGSGAGGGGGGGGSVGVGGNGGTGNSGSPGGNGTAASTGAGGGGGGSSSTTTGGNGSNGGSGQVVIYYPIFV